MISKAAKAVGLESITIGGSLKMDLTKIGSSKGMTFFEALCVLRAAAKKPVALIIDEAQHSLTSEAGEAMMFELKSARDQMNTPDKIDLMLVLSGSDRDKLLRLVNSNAAPFFGSEVKQMPLLGDRFVEHLSHFIEIQRPDLTPVNHKKLLTAFELYGSRPQIFSENLGRTLNPLQGSKARFETDLLKSAQNNQAQEELAMANAYLALLPLEQAVLWRILDQGARFRPYNADNLRFCSEKTGEKITAPRVQKTLEGLRARQPSLIWKSARGEYAIDDTVMTRWYENQVKAGAWPPKDVMELVAQDPKDEPAAVLLARIAKERVKAAQLKLKLKAKA